MEIQFGEQTTLQSIDIIFSLNSLLTELHFTATNRRGQIMVVYEVEVIKDERGHASSIVLHKVNDDYVNKPFNECCESLKLKVKKYPDFNKFKPKKLKVHTELQFILEDNINNIRSDRFYILYSWYIPCAGNESSIVSCAEELVQFVNDNNINIIVVYGDVHKITDENKSLEILKGGNIKIMFLDNINTIPIISSEIEYEIYRLCKKKLL